MNRSNPTRRSILGGITISAAAIGTAIPFEAASGAVDPGFDKALREYRRLRDADVHDSKQGDLRAAYDLHDSQVRAREATYGTQDKSAFSAADREKAERDWEAVIGAEELHYERFSEPRWEAFATFAALPAPTVAALHIKIETALEEDGSLDAISQHIREDVRRLSGKGAAS